TCPKSAAYCGGRARGRPRVQPPRRSDPPAPARPPLHGARADARGARSRPRHDALRRHEAPASPRRRRARHDDPGRPGEAPLPQPGADPVDPRPLDRQVHRAASLCARRAQDTTGGNRMSTVAQRELTYAYFLKASPEQVWEAITNPELTKQYFFGSMVDSTFEPGATYVS